MAEAVVHWAEQMIDLWLQDNAHSSSVAEDYLQMRARRGERRRFEDAMSKAPDVEPEEDDRL